MTKQVTVASVDDLEAGDMEMFEAEGTEILISNVDGNFHATGARCTHYGAPLADGEMTDDGEVVCPWHHAIFDLESGDHAEPPGRDCLQAFEIDEQDGDLVVELPDDAGNERTPEMATREDDDERRTLIIGAGAAGAAAAETLRESGFTGEILVISEDSELPYDRPNLSKAFLSGEGEAAWLPLRSEDFYDEYDIEFELDASVEHLDVDAHRVTLADGSTLTYDAALVATGGEPLQPPIAGLELDNVHLLRSQTDANKIIDDLDDAERAVVVGSSFIGMEVAASLRHRDIDVTVASLESVPFENTLGAEVGAYFEKLHRDNGVDFELGDGVSEFVGDGDEADSVVLGDDTTLDADVFIVGVGVRPATSFLADSDIDLDGQGGIVVDEGLEAAEDVYAAGDVASFPHPETGDLTRIEHWRLAEQQGRRAARRIAGEDVEFDALPFFWTRQFGASFKYVGHAHDWASVDIDGDVEDGDFLAVYRRSNGEPLAWAGTRGAELCAIQADQR